MTLNDIIVLFRENGIPFDTQIAIRAKDDHLLTPEKIYWATPYFGNCREGSNWLDENYPVDEETGDRQECEIVIFDVE